VAGVDFPAAVDQLRTWCGASVVVVVEPDHSVMEGRLHELDSTGTDGALFALDHPDRKTSGVAVALFADAFHDARVDPADQALHIRQGRMEIIVTPTRQGETAAPAPDR
jgi:hypothetical protein